MKNTYPLFLFISILLLTACAPQGTATQVLAPATEPSIPTATQISSSVSPTAGDASIIRNPYTNDIFGLHFQYPFNWYGPQEYVSGQTLRVEVGSDIVFPYGEPPEKPSDIKNSYQVVIQYTKNNQNPAWKDTYQSLTGLKDGDSLASTRSLIIRVKQLELGSFKGFEYIFTLPEAAQTDHVYGREVMLVDEQTNSLLTIMGQPNNVEVRNGADWREVYKTIDEANLDYFHDIVQSITIK